MDVAGRSSEFASIPKFLFPQVFKRRIDPFKILKFPSDFGYFFEFA